MEKINYNYAFVFYDVKECRVNKIFKICKKYFSHFQYSVFRGETSPSKMIRFVNEIKAVAVEQEDFICVIKLKNENVFGEEVIGGKNKVTGENLFL